MQNSSSETGEAPAGGVPVNEAPIGDGLADDAPAGEQPTDDASAGEQPTDDASAGEQPTDDPSEGEQPSDHTPDDTTPEEAPQELPEKVTGLHTTIQSARRVLLEWNVCSGAAFYQVYRKTGSGDYKMLGETRKASYKDTSVTYGKIYRYKVIPFFRKISWSC